MPKKRTVLIIDDDKAISGLLLDVLRSQGFEVCRCDNGASALALSQEKCFDIIVTDYDMPGMNGADIAKSLRFQRPGSFIIGISAAHKEEDFLEAGADAFLKKPFSFKKLIEMINER